MNRKIIKKIVQLGGIDVRRYDKTGRLHHKLYNKFRNYTMIQEDLFVANLDLASRYLNVSGDIVECGVWRGGMVAAIAEIAGPSKAFHLFDSFEGLPKATEIDGEAALAWQKDTTSKEYYDNCSADVSFAVEAMKLSGHNNHKIYQGWFENTLPKYSGGPISILRLDGDWYESVRDCLDALFPKVSMGGLIIVDDYYAWDGCARAVHDYLSESKSTSRVHQWADQVAYIIKKN